MEKSDIASILNVIIIALEVIALIVCFDAFGSIDLIYYTIDSNILLLVSAVLYLIYRNDIPRFVQFIKYSATLSVLITFLVVVFILYPMYDFNVEFLFLTGPNPYMHVLCPIIALVSFVFFESHEIENILKNNIRAIYFTIVYAIILIGLNILKVVNGPYPFLKVYEQSVFMSILWIIIILGFALLLSRLLLKMNDSLN